MKASLASTTRAAYCRSINMLREHLVFRCPGTNPLLISRKHLAGFITHVYSAHCVSSTIVSTMSAISLLVKVVGLADPADNFCIKTS